MCDKLSEANEGWIQQTMGRIRAELASFHLRAFTPELDDRICQRVHFHLTDLRRKLYPPPLETPNMRIVDAPPPDWHGDSFIGNSVIARSGYFEVVLYAHPVIAAQWRRVGVEVTDEMTSTTDTDIVIAFEFGDSRHRTDDQIERILRARMELSAAHCPVVAVVKMTREDLTAHYGFVPTEYDPPRVTFWRVTTRTPAEANACKETSP